MSITAAMVDAMIEAGLTREQMAAMMKASIAEETARLAAKRAKDAERQRKSRASRNVTVTACDSRDIRLAPASPSEVILLPSELKEPSKEKPPKGGQKKGSRIPDDWHPDREEAKRLGLTDAEANSEAAKFRDYWVGKAGKDALKADWPSTWRNWCRRVVENRPASRQTGPPPNRPPTAAEQSRRLRSLIDSESHEQPQRPSDRPPVALLAPVRAVG